ncbi:non-ribosomal peptide synthetase [Streptomyces cinnamoneus]|uniref:non-ribosomal peptide synthetase n=1 Tax=Streptomyces cinnamoneus TaxID=53446 RepID=UPI00378FC1BC
MQSSSITSSYLAGYRRVTGGTRGAAEAEGPGGSGALLPVTGAQRRFLLARRLDPAGRPALVPLFFTFPAGAVDPDRLRAAALHLAALHPALRTRPLVRRGVPLQRVTEPEAHVGRVRPRPGERAEGALLRALARWPAEGPPLRLFLAGDGDGEEILAVVLDHVACDEQSLGRVLADLGDAYRDRLGPHDVPADRAEAGLASYRDAVLLQLDAEDGGSGPRALAHWTRRLAGLRPPGPVPHEGTSAGTGTARRRLPLGVAGGRAAAFPAVLHACARAARTLHGPDRVAALGYPWGGRPAAAAPVLGCFLNTVVHPADDVGPGERTVAWWDDLDHADAPFDSVVHAARGAGVPWSGRLDGLLTFEDLGRRPPLRLGDATGRETHLDDRPLPAPFAVSVSYGTDVLVRMAWDRAAVPDGLARDAFETLLDTLSAAPAS